MLYRIDESKHAVIVQDIQHRSSAYRRRQGRGGLSVAPNAARASLSARPDGNPDDPAEQVAAHLARQAILNRTGAPQLWRILDEGVLHRAIGGSKVMRSRLYRLRQQRASAAR